MPKTRVRTSHRLLAVWLPVAALTLVIATLPDPTHLSPATPATPAIAMGTHSMRAYLDPETGTLGSMPTATTLSAKSLDPALSRSSEGLVQKTLPDGTVMVDLQGRFQNASLAHLDTDGAVQVICTEDASCAHRFLEGKDGATHTFSRPAVSPRRAEVK